MSAQFLIVFAISATVGLAFAVLAYLMSVNAAQLLAAGRNPFKISVGKVSVSTGNALVALFVISAIATLGIPVYFLFLGAQRDDTPVTLDTPPIMAPASKLYIVDEDVGQANEPRIHVYKSSYIQYYTLSWQRFNPVHLSASYDWSNKQVNVTIDGKQFTVTPNGDQAILKDVIALEPASVKAEDRMEDTALTKVPPLSSELRAVPDPVQQQAIAK